MIVNLHQSAAAAFYNTREKKSTKPSSYKERVIADRIIMLIMLIATIIFAIVSA